MCRRARQPAPVWLAFACCASRSLRKLGGNWAEKLMAERCRPCSVHFSAINFSAEYSRMIDCASHESRISHPSKVRQQQEFRDATEEPSGCGILKRSGDCRAGANGRDTKAPIVKGIGSWLLRALRLLDQGVIADFSGLGSGRIADRLGCLRFKIGISNCQPLLSSTGT